MNAYGYNTNRRVAKGYSRFNTIVRFLRAVIAVIAERIGAFELRVIAVAASFAVTLGIGVVVSLFTAVIVTRFLLKSLVGMNIKSTKAYGA